MRLPGAALLIAIGLTILYLASSGNLDRLGKAWALVTSNTPLPDVAGTSAPCDPSKGICDFSNHAVENLLHSMDPKVSVTNPGGIN